MRTICLLALIPAGCSSNGDCATLGDGSQFCTIKGACVGEHGVLWLPKRTFGSSQASPAALAPDITATGEWPYTFFESRLNIPPFTEEFTSGRNPNSPWDHPVEPRLPIGSGLQAAFLRNERGDPVYPPDLPWYDQGLLLGNDPDTSGNPYHFAMHALGGFAARLRMGHMDATPLEVVIDPSRRRPLLTPWQLGLFNLTLLSRSSAVWVDADDLASLGAAASRASQLLGEVPFSGEPAICFRKLTVAGPSAGLLAGTYDSQRVRGLAASALGAELFERYYVTSSSSISERVTTHQDLKNNQCGKMDQSEKDNPVVTLVLRAKDRLFLNIEEVFDAIRLTADTFGSTTGGSKIQLDVVTWDNKTPFEDQVRQASITSVLIAAHGAALVNTIFLPPGSSIIEICPARFSHPIYARLAASSGVHHFRVRTSPTGSFPAYPGVFEGWTSAACDSDIRCRIASRDTNMRVPLGRLSEALSEALDSSVPFAHQPLSINIGLMYNDANGRYDIIERPFFEVNSPKAANI